MSRLILPPGVWEHDLPEPRPCLLCNEPASFAYSPTANSATEPYCSLKHWGRAADSRLTITGELSERRRGLADPPFQAQRWARVRARLPEVGEPGITQTTRGPDDVLLYRDEGGQLVAALVHTPDGQLNVLVAPTHRRRGIGRALVRAAGRRWPIDLADQRMTNAGRGLVRRIDPRQH